MNSLPKSVAIVSNTDWSIYHFRSPLIRMLVGSKIKVYAVAPIGSFVSSIEEMGAEFVPWPLNRKSANFLLDLRSTLDLLSIYRRIKPDLVYHFTIKPNIYGAIAARLTKVPVILGGVTGLGYSFIPGNLFRMTLRIGLLPLYRFAALISDRFTFQNQDDVTRLFGDISPLKSKALVISGGSGVDIRAFSQHNFSGRELNALRDSLGIAAGAHVVLMASRILYEKGVGNFVEAAEMIKRDRPATCFLLAGARGVGNRGAVTAQDLEEWKATGAIYYVGHRDDIPALMSISQVVVHPTYYPEGVPRVLLEAAANEKPIVATDVPGVREIVEHRVTGILVPPKDPTALSGAITELLSNGDLRTRYGIAGRAKVQEFDDTAVAERYFSEYRRLWNAENFNK